MEKGALDEEAAYVASHQFVWGLYLDELLVYDFDDDGDGDFDEIDQENGDKRYYALQDFIYSTHAVINSSGTVQERYDYQPYGGPTAWSPDYTDARSLTPDACVFLFTGQMYDPETGLYHFKARALQAALGRLHQRDPQRDPTGLNLLEYARSAAHSATDPEGRREVWTAGEVSPTDTCCKSYVRNWAFEKYEDYDECRFWFCLNRGVLTDLPAGVASTGTGALAIKYGNRVGWVGVVYGIYALEVEYVGAEWYCNKKICTHSYMSPEAITHEEEYWSWFRWRTRTVTKYYCPGARDVSKAPYDEDWRARLRKAVEQNNGLPSDWEP